MAVNEEAQTTLVMPDKFESDGWYMPVVEKESPELYEIRHIKEPGTLAFGEPVSFL